ncbi:MAG: SH3 domain-containing protein [Candidatus Coatesbacteria bacterium]|nr:MAG: SH3 domain-containing protein [Candidatus Coatesbacteria bacterium]
MRWYWSEAAWVVVFGAALVFALSTVGCKKGEEEEALEGPTEGLYTDFLIIEAKPLVQENDVLDIETHFTLDWDSALESLGIIEREGADLWIGLVITKMEFLDYDGDVVQAMDFEHASYVALLNAAIEHDSDPQIFNRIKYYRGGFTDNYRIRGERPDEMTAAVHFPVYQELGHVTGTLKIYGYVNIPRHYEEKKGKEGIYELVDPKMFDAGLIRTIIVDASGLEPVPVYSKRSGEVTKAIEEEEYIETVTVLPAGLRLRDAPSLDAGVVEVLDRGTKLEVIEKMEDPEGDWYKVRTPDGNIGWARAFYEGDIYLD